MDEFNEMFQNLFTLYVYVSLSTGNISRNSSRTWDSTADVRTDALLARWI